MTALIIVDPVCALSFGHNAAALHYYKEYFKSYNYRSIETYSSNVLPDSVANTYRINKFFSYLYENELPIPSDFPLLHPDSNPRQIAYIEYMDLLNKSLTSDQDTLFLPSADFYSIVALALLAQQNLIPPLMRIRLRLIGVMEHTVHGHPTANVEMIYWLKILINSHKNVAISTETPKYSSYLASKLLRSVAVTPYPLIGEIAPYPEDETFTVFFGGSARIDKGYLRLEKIISKVNDQVGADKLRFLIQSLTIRDEARFAHYTRRLISIPNVTLLADYLTADELYQYSVSSHLFLMPYDDKTYSFRGSAMLMEAIAYGRPVVTQKNLAFEGQVLYYGLGSICNSDDDYAVEIARLLDVDRSELFMRSRQARSRFEVDSEGVYRGWMS